ncbi:MAG: hypothetical protein HKN76_21550 [Saprospiraceae bacterium]|nr:hypothetical protein [Saprospiraceae bacterium]
MRRKIHILFLAILPLVSVGQIIEGDYEYSKEFTWGVNKNSNGGLIGGIVLKHSRIRSERIYTTYGIEFMNVKHPKEQRYTSRQTGTSFIWGKQNFLYSIRFQYGLERLLYKKAPQQGVQISLGVAGGPTMGIEAPYYVLTQSGEYAPYDPDKYFDLRSIQGSGKLLQGIGESSIVPGLNAKAGLSFEFGAFRNNVAGVEIGLLGEVFTRRIILIPTQDNRAFFPSAFFTFFWGTRR